MDSYIIKNTKQFMSLLLANSAFDEFFLESARITTFNTFTIDGVIKKEFYSADEYEELYGSNANTSGHIYGSNANTSGHIYGSNANTSGHIYASYAQVRPYIYEIIKGKRAPISFQIILHAPETMYENNDYEAGVRYILNIKYEDGRVSCVSAISRSDFTLDKTSDQLWDKKAFMFIESLNC